MDAIAFLKQEHAKAKAEFQKLEQASPQQRGQLWSALKPELEVHEQIEEAGLYGPVAKDAPASETTLKQWEQQHRQQVGQAETTIRELSGLNPADPPWLAKVKSLRATLEKHIQEEEQTVWPRIQQVWDRARLEKAGRDLEAMKRQKLPSRP
jgi:iron-sulfur cluster repair protein YtfE (RIC family)